MHAPARGRRSPSFLPWLTSAALLGACTTTEESAAATGGSSDTGESTGGDATGAPLSTAGPGTSASSGSGAGATEGGSAGSGTGTSTATGTTSGGASTSDVTGSGSTGDATGPSSATSSTTETTGAAASTGTDAGTSTDGTVTTGAATDTSDTTGADDPGPTVEVLSYNLYGWNALVQNPWKSDNIVGLINEVRPDFLSAQETEGRADSVRARLTGNYALAGAEQHGVAIFYDADTWELLGDGVANLNEMDQWGQRIVRWGYFQHRALGDRLYVFDTHWCVCSGAQLRGSAATVIEQIQARADQAAPVIFTGDLNVFEGFESSEAVRYLKGELGSPLALVDTFRVVQPTAYGSTFGDAGKIDYIFATPNLTIQAADILRGRIPPGSGSDHEPVVATVALP